MVVWTQIHGLLTPHLCVGDQATPVITHLFSTKSSVSEVFSICSILAAPFLTWLRVAPSLAVRGMGCNICHFLPADELITKSDVIVGSAAGKREEVWWLHLLLSCREACGRSEISVVMKAAYEMLKSSLDSTFLV